MINTHNALNFCSEDISLIENYDIAINDKNNIYDCHHRLGIKIPKNELIEQNMYYNRPASELIFLLHSEHARIHSTGRTMSEEARLKSSEKQKGRIFTEEHKERIKNALNKYYESHESPMLGTHLSEERKQYLSNYFTGRPNEKNKGEKNGMYGKHAVNSKRIIQYDLNHNIVKVWDCLRDISKELHISLKEVINTCKYRRDSFKNFIWRYETIL